MCFSKLILNTVHVQTGCFGGDVNRLRVASVDEIWKFSLGLLSIILTHLETVGP